MYILQRWVKGKWERKLSPGSREMLETQQRILENAHRLAGMPIAKYRVVKIEDAAREEKKQDALNEYDSGMELALPEWEHVPREFWEVVKWQTAKK